MHRNVMLTQLYLLHPSSPAFRPCNKCHTRNRNQPWMVLNKSDVSKENSSQHAQDNIPKRYRIATKKLTTSFQQTSTLIEILFKPYPSNPTCHRGISEMPKVTLTNRSFTATTLVKIFAPWDVQTWNQIWEQHESEVCTVDRDSMFRFGITTYMRVIEVFKQILEYVTHTHILEIWQFLACYHICQLLAIFALRQFSQHLSSFIMGEFARAHVQKFTILKFAFALKVTEAHGIPGSPVLRGKKVMMQHLGSWSKNCHDQKLWSISFLLIHVGSSSNFWLSLWPVLSFFLGNFCHFLFNWNFLTTASFGCGIVPRRLGRYIFFWNWVLLAGFSYLKNSKNSDEESLRDFGSSPQVLACSIYIGLYYTEHRFH